MTIIDMQEARTLQQAIAMEGRAVTAIRRAVNDARRRLHLPEVDYTNVPVGRRL